VSCPGTGTGKKPRKEQRILRKLECGLAHVKKVRGEIYYDQLLAPVRVLFLIGGGVSESSPSNLFRKNNARHVREGGRCDIGLNAVPFFVSDQTELNTFNFHCTFSFEART
jgi:hypothetical protein